MGFSKKLWYTVQDRALKGVLSHFFECRDDTDWRMDHRQGFMTGVVQSFMISKIMSKKGAINMKKRILAAFLSLCMTAAALTGCGQPADIESGAAEQDFPVSVEDVTIQSQPEGVAVLSSNIADVILALGYEGTLKARSADCTQPDLAVLPEVTVDDGEKMKELGVTLLFSDMDLTLAQCNELEKQGITVLALSPASSRAEFTTLYTQVASAMAGGNTGYEKGEKTAQNIFTTLDDITRIIPDSDTPATAVYMTDLEGSAATGDTFGEVLLSAAGFINGLKGETGGKVDVSKITTANPAYIFCPTGLKEQLEASDTFKDLDAVKNGNVCELDPELMEWQGRSIITAVSQMAGFAHPELLETNSSKDETSSESSESSASSETSEAEPTPTPTPKPTPTPTPTPEPESSSSESTSYRQLQKGDSGDDVLKMQERLDELGYMFTLYDGTFDQGTEQAVKDFQLYNGFLTTGVARPDVLEVLYSDEAVPNS